MKNEDQLLDLTPFTKEQKVVKYDINKFTEHGQLFAMLIPQIDDDVKSERYTAYRFGVRLHNGKMNWFFGGNYTCGNRSEARKVFKMLHEYSSVNGLGTVFASK